MFEIINLLFVYFKFCTLSVEEQDAPKGLYHEKLCITPAIFRTVHTLLLRVGDVTRANEQLDPTVEAPGMRRRFELILPTAKFWERWALSCFLAPSGTTSNAVHEHVPLTAHARTTNRAHTHVPLTAHGTRTRTRATDRTRTRTEKLLGYTLGCKLTSAERKTFQTNPPLYGTHLPRQRQGRSQRAHSRAHSRVHSTLEVDT